MATQSAPQPFGPLLRQQIERAGISILELARRLGEHPEQVHKLLRGDHEPRARRLFAISRALGVGVDVWEPAFRE